MTDSWIVAIIEDLKTGEKMYHQFDNEEELRYFLAIHEEDCRLIKASRGGEN